MFSLNAIFSVLTLHHHVCAIISPSSYFHLLRKSHLYPLLSQSPGDTQPIKEGTYWGMNGPFSRLLALSVSSDVGTLSQCRNAVLKTDKLKLHKMYPY